MMTALIARASPKGAPWNWEEMCDYYLRLKKHLGRVPFTTDLYPYQMIFTRLCGGELHVLYSVHGDEIRRPGRPRKAEP